MGTFVKGDVVVAPFPFSDLSATKKRPALVIATLTGNDVILCQITTQAASRADDRLWAAECGGFIDDQLDCRAARARPG